MFLAVNYHRVDHDITMRMDFFLNAKSNRSTCVKFICSEKATKFDKISVFFLTLIMLDIMYSIMTKFSAEWIVIFFRH